MLLRLEHNRALVAAAWLLLCLAGFSAHAELSAYEGRYRLAMEVELHAHQVERLTPFIDWEQVEKEIKAGDFVVDEATTEQIAREGRPLAQCSAFLLGKLFRIAMYEEMPLPLLFGPNPKDNPLYGMKWHPDGYKFEFKFETPTQSPTEYLQRLNRFAKAAGVPGELAVPLAGSSPLSFHLHISRTDGKDIRAHVAALNRLTLMRMVNARAAENLFDFTRVTQYNEDIKKRSVVRLVSKDHFEARRHTLAPEQELEEILPWLDMPQADAEKAIRAATLPLVTDENVAWLIQRSLHGAASVLGEFPPGLSDPRFLNALNRAVTENQVDDLVVVLEVLKRQSLNGNLPARALLRKISTDWQREFLKKAPTEWFNSTEPHLLLALLRTTHAHCDPKQPSVGFSDPRLAIAVEALMRLGPDVSTPEYIDRLVLRNKAVRQVGCRHLASGEIPASMLSPMLRALSVHLKTEAGWATVRQLILNSDKERLKILQQHLYANRALYSADQYAEVRDAVAGASRPYSLQSACNRPLARLPYREQGHE